MKSQIKWLIPVALTCVAFGLNVQSAKAQTSVNKEFEITYNTLFTLMPIEEQSGFFTANISGTSKDNTVFGLTNFESNTFGKLVSEESITDKDGNKVPVTQQFKFNANPNVLGLENPPQSVIDKRVGLGIPNSEENSDIYFGNSANKLFGKADDMATINFFPPGSPDFPGRVSGGGTITITGGTGIFENANGKITFEQNDKLPLDQNAPAPGVATLKFTVQTPRQVPESTNAFGLLTGIVGTGLILRRKGHKVTLKP
ncbi:PEP-CTERM sorting domain-containing protein [Rivularia sp. UHCC 0363]|uniref:PEP-CTERM sorting domain-containing protein n=1 Tax=Rivularia sp. UHCC 0363 TaxID=3110244 RepID=UPI002B21F5C4|nr:PEP-CTERM sorting domain-containing protein [Rivularia sp. UHCC 0363]MEA5598014.1 PEP-CTERM sorting domain-containing protein [Rivularia sp. UHCC 0363]